MNNIEIEEWKKLKTKRMCIIILSFVAISFLLVGYNVGIRHEGEKFWRNLTFFIGLMSLFFSTSVLVINKLKLITLMRVSKKYPSQIYEKMTSSEDLTADENIFINAEKSLQASLQCSLGVFVFGVFTIILYIVNWH